MKVAFTLNGRPVAAECAADSMAVALLREALGVASVRATCGIGLCGTCTILVDGETASSCLMPAPMLAGRAVTTIEGLPEDDPVARGFEAEIAYQCGFCTPAMVLAARHLLAETPAPTDAEIDLALAGNLCRCGCYVKIRAAVRWAAARIGEQR